MTAQTAIANRTDAQPIRWCEPELPLKISTLLDQALRFTDMPVVGPATASQLRDYVAACQPPMPSEDQVNRMLTRLANNLRSPKLSDDEAEERMKTCRRMLAAYTLPDLHAAYDQILLRHSFFPTIAEVETIVAPIRAKRMSRVNRAQSLIMKHEREWKEPQPLLTADEAAQLGRILAAPLAGRRAVAGE